MKYYLKQKVRKIILYLATFLGLNRIKIKIKNGIAKNINWTLLPYSMYWRGEFEKLDEVALIIQSLKSLRGFICWDLGAHFGFYSLVLAKRIGPEGKVYAFEPDPFSFKKFRYHLKINNFKNIVPFNLAVGKKNSFAFLDQSQGEGEPIAKIVENKDLKKTVMVKVIKLDTLVKRKIILPPGLIKIDVEGYGHQAIAGAIKTIKKYKPLIIFSFHLKTHKKELNQTINLLRKFYTPLDKNGKELNWEKIQGTVLLKVIIRP